MLLRGFCLLVALWLAAFPAEAKRVALVIGNNAYPNLPDENQLKKAVNDAAAMKQVLESDLGFTTFFGQNADWKKMNVLIKQLEGSVEPGDIAFIYFSGHGIQLKEKTIWCRVV